MIPISPDKEAQAALGGEVLFVEKCALERRVPAGQALLKDRQSLPAAYSARVIRRGLCSIPQIREAELNDPRLSAIASYLETRQ